MYTGVEAFLQSDITAPVGIYPEERPFLHTPCQHLSPHLSCCCLDRVLLLPRLTFAIILTQSSTSWDYRHVSPSLYLLCFIIAVFISVR